MPELAHLAHTLTAATTAEVDPLLLALLPVGAGVLGSLLTMAGQALSDRRTHKRETKARHDQLWIQLYQEDRDNLHALQKSLVDIAELYAMAMSEHTVHLRDNGDAKIKHLLKGDQVLRSNKLLAQQMAWHQRCRSGAVREAVEAHMTAIHDLQTCETLKELHDCWEKHNEAFGDAQKAIGEELRRSPLDAL
ncbi:hypothetical protein [Microtetraspora malaysiensis]|uniref:hypothetical protein n=1 Tax=Microtetraspora malaysiensis TaxID=161358 RepID=UPI00082E116F|nr:hypothetical protein [Microtetraspora malaysiensis]